MGVANLLRAKASGVWPEVAKLTEEKETPPEETSGTLEMVLRAVLHVTRPLMLLTEVTTSAGRAVLPMTKQAEGFWRAMRSVEEPTGASACLSV